MKAWWLPLFSMALLVSPGCGAPKAIPARWPSEPPAITHSEDRFTLKVLELDESGSPKSKEQWEGVLAAAGQADDVVLFMHGWRRDARDVGTMEAFLKIYRGAFECLAQRDVEGTEACRATHTFCHPASKTSKLVILVLWNGRSGLFGFKKVQQRAYEMRSGLLKVLEAIHKEVHERGTFLVLGHSLGGTALASAIFQGAEAGHIPVDGALLVVGAFNSGQFSFPADTQVASAGGTPLLLNLFNRSDGYLRFYRWMYGTPTAGETGLKEFPTTPGASWVREGRQCGATGETSLGASLFASGKRIRCGKDGVLDILNMDATGLIRGHTNIEDEPSLRIYNRVAAEMLFQILWDRVPRG